MLYDLGAAAVFEIAGDVERIEHDLGELGKAVISLVAAMQRQT